MFVKGRFRFSYYKTFVTVVLVVSNELRTVICKTVFFKREI